MSISDCIQSVFSLYLDMAWSNPLNILYSYLTYIDVHFSLYLKHIEAVDHEKK